MTSYTEMTIRDILENATGISGFGGQITEDNLLDFCESADQNVDTTLSKEGVEKVLSGGGLERGKFEFVIPGRGVFT